MFLNKKLISVMLCAAFSGTLFVLFVRPADAFFKKRKIQKLAPLTDVSENPSYRIFFSIEPSAEVSPSVKGSWAEVNYKVVNGADSPGPLFDNAPGGTVRFLDKDGFVVASDYFLNEDFQKMDFYSSLPVERHRAGAIVTADAVPLKEGELEILQKERAEKKERKLKEEELFQLAVHSSVKSEEPATLKSIQPQDSYPSKAHETILPLPLPGKAETIDTANPAKAASEAVSSASAPVPAVPVLPLSVAIPQSASPLTLAAGPQVIIQQASNEKIDKGSGLKPVVESTKIISEPLPQQPSTSKPLSSVPIPNSVTAVKSAIKIRNTNSDKNKDLLDIDGPKNEDLQKILSEMDKKPATEIKESPSEIPGFPLDTNSTDTSQ